VGAAPSKLKRLRPVSFHLKSDPQGALQYGLIAEEVAQVYPELVTRDSEGRIEGVHYDELAPLLLNELQQQAAQLSELRQQLAALRSVSQSLQTALTRLESRAALAAER